MKKFLSLVLALVMTMSLVTISAGAKDFTDADKVNYTEAVDVISTIGVVDGDKAGNINPQGGLTRGAAAKIICNLILGPTTAAELNADTNPYPDVDKNSTFGGYIAYCQKEGIISGYADGTFKPSNPLTGYAFMKMLLGALGYDAAQEGYTGANWSINVAKKAIGIGLNAGLEKEFNGSDFVNREEAMLYAFNTLQATMVEYAEKQTIVVGSATINTVVPAQEVSWGTAKVNNDGNIKADGHVQFAEKYFAKLVKNPDTDAFMRPAYTWTWKGGNIGTYVDYAKMVAEYTTAVTGKDVYEVIGKTAFEKYDFESYVDGAKKDAVYKCISKNNKGDVDYTGNGALTQVFMDNDEGDVVVTVINTYLAEATTDYNAKKDTATFKIYGANVKDQTVSGEDFDIASVEEGDFVLVNYSYDTEAVEVISDVEILGDVAISRFTSDDEGGDKGTTINSVTVDGTKYSASEKLDYDVDVLENYTNSNLKDKTYNVYLDQYGYLIGVEEVSAPNTYLFITGVNGGTDYLATANYEANAIFMDGTTEVIKVKSNPAIRDAVENASSAALVNQWFKYTKNSNGVYTLTAIGSNLSNGATVAQERVSMSSNSKINDRNISLQVNKADNGKFTKVYGNEKSVYLLADLDTVTVDGTTYGVISGVDEVTTGVENVDIAVKNDAYVANKLSTKTVELVWKNCSGGTYALYDDDGVVIAAVVIGESEGIASDVVYVLSSKAASEAFNDGTWGWEREVVLNGKLVTLTEVDDNDESVLADEMKQFGWYIVKYDADGNVKSAKPFATEKPAQHMTSLENAVTALRTEDLVILNINTGVAYSKNGRTIYDWSATGKQTDDGIIVSNDVNIVLKQTNKHSTTTEEYTGWKQLTSILDTLNTTLNYDFDAVIEKGRITSVVIYDRTGNGDVVGPNGSTVSGKAGISADKNTGKVTVSLGYKVAADGVTYADVKVTQMDNSAVNATQRINFAKGDVGGSVDFSDMMSIGKTYKAEVTIGGVQYTTIWAYNG